MKEKLLKKNNWILACISLGLFAFLFVAIHDVQSAQGVGLFLSMKAGAADRLPFDLAVDVAAVFGAAVLVLIPCLLLKWRSLASVLRLFIAFLGFMPVLDLAQLVHLIMGNTKPELSAALRSGDLWTAFIEGAEFSVSLLQMIIPMLVLLLAVSFFDGNGKNDSVDCQNGGQNVIKRWYFVALIIGAVAEICVFLFPNMAFLLCFVMAYVILLIMFDLWEKLVVIYPGLGTWGWILFGGLGLRGIYRLLELMSAFKLQ